MNLPGIQILPNGNGHTPSVKDKIAARALIAQIEERIKAKEQLEFEIKHHFSHGVYAREMFVPKGSIIVGKIHKFENMNIISQGDVSFFSIDGVKRVIAPFTFVASKGTKRVIFAHEDTVWTTIHGTHETDLKKIEEYFIANDYSEVLGNDEIKLIEEARKCLGL